jgi:hypothetical protein
MSAPPESINIPRRYLKWYSAVSQVFLTHLQLPLQMFVFGEVQDPNMDTVYLIEDIVRSQLVELVRAILLHSE